MPTDEAKTKTRGCKQLPPALLPSCPGSYKESSVGARDHGSLEHGSHTSDVKRKPTESLCRPASQQETVIFSRVEEVRE